MKRIRRKSILLVSLAVVVGTAIFVTQVVFSKLLATSLARFGVGVYQFVLGLPQAVFWCTPLGILGTWILVSLAHGWIYREPSKPDQPMPSGAGALAAITSQVRRGHRSALPRALLVNELSESAILLIGARDGLAPHDARERFHGAQWTNDPSVLALLCLARGNTKDHEDFLNQLDRTLTCLEALEREV